MKLSEEMTKWLDHQDSTLDDDVYEFVKKVEQLEARLERKP